jgi:hypothetical protein
MTSYVAISSRVELLVYCRGESHIHFEARNATSGGPIDLHGHTDLISNLSLPRSDDWHLYRAFCWISSGTARNNVSA